MKVQLCSTDSIEDPGSHAFSIEHDNKRIDLFVVHQWGEFHGYINSCPHTGVNLEWQEHQFLDRGNEFIQCSTHDALFEIPTGLCIHGPCVGASLEPVTLEISDGNIEVVLD